MWTIFKVFIELITTLLLFHVLVFWPQGMWDPSSLTRDRNHSPSTRRQSLNHGAAREVPRIFYIHFIKHDSTQQKLRGIQHMSGTLLSPGTATKTTISAVSTSTLVCVRYCSKPFTCFSSLHPHNLPMKQLQGGQDNGAQITGSQRASKQKSQGVNPESMLSATSEYCRPCFLLAGEMPFEKIIRGFSGGSVVKNLPAKAGHIGSIPDPGRSHMQWNN